MAYKMKENEVVKHYVIFLRDKHLFSTATLNHFLAKAEANKSSNEGDLKCVSNMIKLWIVIQTNLLNTISKVFEAMKKRPQ